MSGHSKWSTIKHKKAALDSKRGKVFTKLSRALTTAARDGGGDPLMNANLRLAIDKAKAQNMPNDNIDRAIKRGTGEIEGVEYEEITYEGYGPGGVAVFIETMTDNRNRTVADIRFIFSKNNGTLGNDGCVAWMFDSVGQVVLPAEGVDEDELLMVAVEGGADNMEREGDDFVMTCAPDRLAALSRALQAAGYTQVSSAELTRVPQNMADVDVVDAELVYKLLNALEDYDDVQQVYANCAFDDELLARLEG